MQERGLRKPRFLLSTDRAAERRIARLFGVMRKEFFTGEKI